MIEMMNDEEFYEYKKNLIKETFTEEDFLSCEKTKQILEDNFLTAIETERIVLAPTLFFCLVPSSLINKLSILLVIYKIHNKSPKFKNNIL